MEEDRIAKTFAGRCIFITGGTGFLGKVLVEKLLRCCPEIKKIYLLIRQKKGKDPLERIKDMFSNVLFDLVKKERGEDEILRQCEALCGDASMLNLNMSDNDKQIIRDNVSVIYHCAATIRFDEELKKAVLLNVRGTKYILELAKECKGLELFAYISTAYCHLHIKHLLERPYDPPADPHRVINTVEWLDDDAIASITKKLCRVHRRIQKGFEVFEYYANNQWDFDNSSVLELRKNMNDTERKKYIIEKIDLDLVEYFEACTLCARRYILNETDETIPAARRHMKIMYCIDKLCKLLFLGFLVYYIGFYIYKRFLDADEAFGNTKENHTAL